MLLVDLQALQYFLPPTNLNTNYRATRHEKNTARTKIYPHHRTRKCSNFMVINYNYNNVYGYN